MWKKENKIASDEIIDKYHDQKPQLVWLMNHDVLIQIRKIKDAEGKHLWLPDLVYENKPGNLLGVDIVISKEPGYRLAILKKGGTILEL